MRASPLLIALLATPAAAQVLPAQLDKPPSVAPAKPAAPATSSKLVSLQAELKAVEGKIAELKAKKDKLSEMSQQDMLQLQQAMDKKSQLETMISNTMKASSDSQNSLTQASKGS